MNKWLSLIIIKLFVFPVIEVIMFVNVKLIKNSCSPGKQYMEDKYYPYM